MKVLFVSGVKGVSGAEIVLARFLRSVTDFQPVILVPRGPLQMQLVQDGHRVHVSRALGELRRSRNPLWPLVFVLRWLLSTLEIVRVCLKERPDIVHAGHLAAAIYAALPAQLFRIPVVWHIHDIIVPRTLPAKVCRLLAKRVGRIVAVSDATRQSLVRNGVPASKITVVYNGIDCRDEFNPELVVPGTLRQKYGIDTDVLLIGVISVLVHWKGVHFFLDAIERLRFALDRPVHFFIIGDSWRRSDRYKRHLMERSKVAGLHGLVSFTGRLPNIREVLADLDIVVHTSIAPDPLPNVILEAMAMGKLIIASRCGGLPEIVDHGVTGFLYPPGDLGALTSLMHQSIRDFKKLTAFGQRARRAAEYRFAEKSHKEAVLHIYRELAAVTPLTRRTAVA